jgi:hypothetical protein
MSDTKINSVVNFPKPLNNTNFRSFLGLANYFRDFVPNYFNIVNPLHKVIDYSALKKSKTNFDRSRHKFSHL